MRRVLKDERDSRNLREAPIADHQMVLCGGVKAPLKLSTQNETSVTPCLRAALLVSSLEFCYDDLHQPTSNPGAHTGGACGGCRGRVV